MKRTPMEYSMELLHVRMKALRLHLGLSEQEMAARLGMSARAYRARERSPVGRGWHHVLIRLHEEFNVSIDWLVFGANGDRPRNDRLPLTPYGEPITPALRLAIADKPPAA